MKVIADTSTISYAVLIGEIDTLHKLYGHLIVPEAVFHELRNEKAPAVVRAWAEHPPAWVKVHDAEFPASPVKNLGPGETQVILLAQELGRTSRVLIMMDERNGRREAQRHKLPVTGLLGALQDAGLRGFTDFPRALNNLQTTTDFYLSPNLARSILARFHELVLERDRGIER